MNSYAEVTQTTKFPQGLSNSKKGWLSYVSGLRLPTIAVTSGALLAVGLGITSSLLWSARGYIQERIIAEAHHQGIALSAKEFSPGIFSSSASSVKAVFRNLKMPFDVFVDNITINPSWLSLRNGTFNATAEASLYNGMITMSVSTQPTQGSASGSGTITKLELAKHPLLSAFGLANGSVSSVVDSLIVKDNKLSTLSASFSLDNLSFPKALQIPASLTGLGLPITIPALASANVTGNISMVNNHLELKELVANTSWGTIHGNSIVDIVAFNTNRELLGELRIELSEEGSKLFGGFLPLMSKNAIQSSNKKFTVSLGKEIKFRSLE
jgi:hypothetical protein